MVTGDHHRQAGRQFIEEVLDGEERRLGVEGVEDGLDQQDFGAALDEGPGLFVIGRDELVESDGAIVGPVDVRGEGGGAVGGAEGAGDENAPLELVRAPARGAHAELGRGPVDVRHVGLGLVVGLGDAGAVEGVGRDDVGARRDEGAMESPRSGRVASGRGCRCRPGGRAEWPRKRSPRKSASDSWRACAIVPLGPSRMTMRCSNRRRSSAAAGEPAEAGWSWHRSCISTYQDMMI